MESVLNPADLKRIEAIHRGFLYQHLFAVSCLLLQPPELIAVAIERDEDVELIFPDRRVYVQVKTRAAVINRDDLEGTLNRVDLIRADAKTTSQIRRDRIVPSGKHVVRLQP